MTKPSRSETVTLYAAYGSFCSVKARGALVEKGVSFVERRMNIGPANEHFQPWYVRLNPRIVVPTLDDKGHIVCDSLVIMRYVDDHFEGPPLRGTNNDEQRAVERWVDTIDALDVRAFSMSSILGGRMRGLVRGLMGPYRIRQAQQLKKKHPELAAAYQSKIDDYQGLVATMSTPQQLATKRAEVHDCLAQLEHALADRAFVVGDQFSLADLMATGLVARVKLCQQFDAKQYPHLDGYYARMKERPQFTKSGYTDQGDRTEIAKMMAPFVVPRLLALLLLITSICVAACWLSP